MANLSCLGIDQVIDKPPSVNKIPLQLGKPIHTCTCTCVDTVHELLWPTFELKLKSRLHTIASNVWCKSACKYIHLCVCVCSTYVCVCVCVCVHIFNHESRTAQQESRGSHMIYSGWWISPIHLPLGWSVGVLGKQWISFASSYTVAIGKLKATVKERWKCIHTDCQ